MLVNDFISACLGKETNNKVKAGMAIAEAHANVTSFMSHGGFNLVYKVPKPNTYLISNASEIV